MTHICVKIIIAFGSDNGLSPGRRQAIILINDGMLLNGTLEIHFSDILIEIKTFTFNEMHSEMSYAKSSLFRLCLTELTAFVLWESI